MRRLGFMAVGGLAAWLLLELFAGLLLWFFGGAAAPAGVADGAIAPGTTASEVAPPEMEASMALHPYLGFVANPEARAEWEPLSEYLGLGVSNFGFFDTETPFRKAAPDRLVIGVFGGSAALYYSVHGIEASVAELREQPALRDLEIVVVRAAIQGYKQPQQLLALSYLLALGAHFDVVVNLDGFNEVTLPVAENIAQGTSPYFPRQWKTRVEGLPDLEAQALAGRVSILREGRHAWAEFFDRPPMCYSAIASLVWRALDRARSREIHTTLAALEQREGPARSYATTGPPGRYASDDEMYADFARIWENASLQMARLTEGAGGHYLHFLQPNQYVPDSKPLGDAELEIAFDAQFPLRPHVVAGYPQLREAGARLQAQGVNFHDLTRLFEDRPEPLYGDACCHLNLEGNRQLGRAIGAALAVALATPTGA